MHKIISVKTGIELGDFLCFLYVTKHIFCANFNIYYDNDP